MNFLSSLNGEVAHCRDLTKDDSEARESSWILEVIKDISLILMEKDIRNLTMEESCLERLETKQLTEIMRWGLKQDVESTNLCSAVCAEALDSRWETEGSSTSEISSIHAETVSDNSASKP